MILSKEKIKQRILFEKKYSQIISEKYNKPVDFLERPCIFTKDSMPIIGFIVSQTDDNLNIVFKKDFNCDKICKLFFKPIDGNIKLLKIKKEFIKEYKTIYEAVEYQERMMMLY